MENNFKCPSCGCELKASDNGFFVCQACGKAFRRAERAPQTSERPTSVQQTEPPVQQPAEQPAAEQQQPATASQPAEPAYAAYGAPQPAYQGAGEAAQPTTPADVYTPARKGYVKGRWWVSRVSMAIMTLLLGLIAVGLCFGVGGDEFVSAILGAIGIGACIFAAAVLVLALVSRNTEVSVWALIGMMIATYRDDDRKLRHVMREHNQYGGDVNVRIDPRKRARSYDHCFHADIRNADDVRHFSACDARQVGDEQKVFYDIAG